MTDAIQPEISDLIEAKDFQSLKAIIRNMEIHYLTELISELHGEELAVAFRLLGKEEAADIFGDLAIEQQEELVETLSSDKVATLVNDMPADDRTELLEELPGEVAQRLLNLLRGDQLQIARTLLNYPEDSIGRRMTPSYLAVRPDWTITHILAHIRSVGEGKETLNAIYVVNDHWKLLDELRLEQIVLADEDALASDLMDEQVTFLEATDDQETAVDKFKKYDAIVLPVVNSQRVLVGIVTVDDILDVAEEEDTEDIQKMAGMSALEHNYFSTGFGGMLRKRLPTLAMLLCVQMLTTLALTNYTTMQMFAVLVLFMPLINSPAGNTGSQMSALMIRGMAVQEVNLGDWLKVLKHELVRGVVMGLFLGVIGFMAAYMFSPLLRVDGGAQIAPDMLYKLAIAVAVAIPLVVTLANLVGAMLPFIFKRVGLDPAVTSGPFIASLMDLSGTLVYFSVAAGILLWAS